MTRREYLRVKHNTKIIPLPYHHHHHHFILFMLTDPVQDLQDVLRKSCKGCKTTKLSSLILAEPVPVAARSTASVCGRMPAGILGSNTAGSMDVCLL